MASKKKTVVRAAPVKRIQFLPHPERDGYVYRVIRGGEQRKDDGLCWYNIPEFVQLRYTPVPVDLCISTTPVKGRGVFKVEMHYGYVYIDMLGAVGGPYRQYSMYERTVAHIKWLTGSATTLWVWLEV